VQNLEDQLKKETTLALTQKQEIISLNIDLSQLTEELATANKLFESRDILLKHKMDNLESRMNTIEEENSNTKTIVTEVNALVEIVENSVKSHNVVIVESNKMIAGVVAASKLHGDLVNKDI